MFLGAENAQLISTTRDLLERVRGLERSHCLEFLKVKAHSQNRWNDRADELAKLGASMMGVSTSWRRYTKRNISGISTSARYEKLMSYVTDDGWSYSQDDY